MSTTKLRSPNVAPATDRARSKRCPEVRAILDALDVVLDIDALDHAQMRSKRGEATPGIADQFWEALFAHRTMDGWSDEGIRALVETVARWAPPDEIDDMIEDARAEAESTRQWFDSPGRLDDLAYADEERAQRNTEANATEVH